ncbi:MAG TPA: histidine kinase dimerization/phosphoacceptor domain -containing protein [Reyranellaceae bacterium]|nr:histidine kinase dimerization/phosphoacceptor domain -containing protein [Reyranellaceae bacterium]
MKRLSLKARLLLVLALALAPAVTLGAVRAREKLTEAAELHAVAANSAIEIAQLRHRQVIEATRQLLHALAVDEQLSPWASGKPEAIDYGSRCDAHLRRILDQFRSEYSAITLVDETGTGRCSSAEAGRGMRFDDRDYFVNIKENPRFAVGRLIASRLSPLNVQPAAVPILRDGKFKGLVVIGVTLNWFTDVSTVPRPEVPVYLSLIDRSGQAMATSGDGAGTLPRPARIADALEQRLRVFRDYARNGERYDYRMASLGYGAMLVVSAVPVAAQKGALNELWTDLLMIFLSSAIGLGALWIAAERWCVQPLKPIQAAASAIARGDPAPPRPRDGSTPPEMEALTNDVFAMAQAIRVREGELQSNLEQREHMLREIHHRVKNNLQMISSLLSLQAEKIRSPRILQLFTDAQNRLLTMSILHRHLYERSNWTSVDFQAYINDLVRHLSANRIVKDQPEIKFSVRAPVWNVGPDTAIPVGLVVTEAVSNAFAHAFAGVEQPQVRITAEEQGGDWELTIEDNGRGLSQGFSVDAEHNGLGVMLMRGLAAQLGGELAIAGGPDGGTVVRLRFPKPVPPADDLHPLDRREPRQKPEKLEAKP